VRSDTANSKDQAENKFTIFLLDLGYQPAAVAVLAGLYMVKPWSELFADLTPRQQLQAAVLADMWQLPAASHAAVELLQAATGHTAIPSVVLEQLLSLDAVPHFLLTLFEQVLLSKYGNLEAVWAPGNTLLQDSLLALPLYAMELLLASDKLKVRGWLGANPNCTRLDRSTRIA
jgi:hypothetical protein